MVGEHEGEHEDGHKMETKKEYYEVDIKADVAVCVHVWMVAWRDELDRGGRVRIVGGERKRKLVREAFIHRACATLDRADPLKQIFSFGEGCPYDYIFH